MNDRTSRHRPRVLALVARFKWSHIDYLAALAEQVDLWVGWSGVGHAGAPERAVFEGIRAHGVGSLAVDGEATVAKNLQTLVADVQPDLVHVLYYTHERLTVLARYVLGAGLPLVWECRDPITTLEGAAPGSPAWRLEAEAIAAADGHILVSDALRRYLERSHDLDLGAALIVPHAFAARNAGPAAAKLSAIDGRTHLALVGTADGKPGHGRYYVDVIRRLVGLGFVIHSHFHDVKGESLDPYRQLAAELDDYHQHPTVSFRDGWQLSSLTSRYDLMGVFHELDAPQHNESQTLAVCMPTKAVSGWLHGQIPVVTLPHYRGLVERIERLGIGFVVGDWQELSSLVGAWDRIASATAACAEHRAEFTHEHQVGRIARFYAGMLERTAASPARHVAAIG